MEVYYLYSFFSITIPQFRFSIRRVFGYKLYHFDAQTVSIHVFHAVVKCLLVTQCLYFTIQPDVHLLSLAVRYLEHIRKTVRGNLFCASYHPKPLLFTWQYDT